VLSVAHRPHFATQISKEESAYVDSATNKVPAGEKLVLNTIGAPQMKPTAAAESHLVGSGALVRKPQPVHLPALGGLLKAVRLVLYAMAVWRSANGCLDHVWLSCMGRGLFVAVGPHKVAANEKMDMTC
jgi:hypothetical protein